MKAGTLMMKNNRVIDWISTLWEYIFGFVCTMVVSCALIGTVFVFFDLYWGWGAMILTFVVSAAGACYLKRRSFFRIDNGAEILTLLVLAVVVIFIYIQYSPTLEVRQDPSVYIYKALNLVNYGHVYQPMHVYEDLLNRGLLAGFTGGSGTGIMHNGAEVDYALIQNGTSYENGNLYTDFFPGGAFVYAIIGKIHKSWIFYGQTLIMLVNAGLFYFAAKSILKRRWNAVTVLPYILAFFVAPVIVFFGRGSFSEPIALTLLLFLICLLSKRKDVTEFSASDIVFLAFVLLNLYSVRMDYLLVAVLGIFIITWLNLKAGAIYSALLAGVYLLFNQSYWIYSYRIFRDDLPVLKYGIWIIAGVFVVSFFISRFGKKIFSSLYYSRAVKVLYTIACVVLVLFMFRNNIVSSDSYEMDTVHGTVMMTYSEFIFDLLFLVFPSIILVGGILGLPGILKNKKIPFVANVFLIGTISMYLVYFLRAGNSPQLYWFLRRYFYVVLPVATISFLLLMMRANRRVCWIVGVVCFLLSVNLYAESDQTVNYDGLDKSVEQVCAEWEENGIEIVLYDTEDRYRISSLMIYSDLEFVPCSEDKLYDVLDELSANGYDMDSCLYLTSRHSEDASQYILTYNTLGEQYGEVPRDSYSNTVLLYGYTPDQCVAQKDIVYPGFFYISTEGVYEDSTWTAGYFRVECENFKVSDNAEYLVIELYESYNEYLDNDRFDDLGNRVLIDGEELTFVKYDNYRLYFEMPADEPDEISEVEVYVNTFNPAELNISSDSRDLGLDIRQIYLE